MDEQQEARAKDAARIKFHERRELETNEHDFAFLDGYDAGLAAARPVPAELRDAIATVKQALPEMEAFANAIAGQTMDVTIRQQQTRELINAIRLVLANIQAGSMPEVRRFTR